MTGVAGSVEQQKWVNDSVRVLEVVLLENSHRPSSWVITLCFLFTTSLDPCNNPVGVGSVIMPMFQVI